MTRFDDDSDLTRLVAAFARDEIRPHEGREDDPEGLTRLFVGALARAGLLRHAVPSPHGAYSCRDLAQIRYRLAYQSSLADTAFAMQGLGSHPLALAGTDALKDAWLPRVVDGTAIAAFALTEANAGSDLAGVETRAVECDGAYRLTGEKTFISNAGIAHFYTVLARTSDGHDPKGLSMFFVDAGEAGLAIERLAPMAPHPIGRVTFDGVRATLLGQAGEGYALALRTLDAFRPTVGAAACGLAHRALDEAIAWTKSRRQFGTALCDFQATQMALAEMSVDLEAGLLLVMSAAWLVDDGARSKLASARAKLFATEMAQRVVDRSVQLHGGAGVMRGSTVERLYREVRALRIYEGTSEIQKLIIARELLKGE